VNITGTPARWGDEDEETEVSPRLLSKASGWRRDIEKKAVKKKMLSESATGEQAMVLDRTA